MDPARRRKAHAREHRSNQSLSATCHCLPSAMTEIERPTLDAQHPFPGLAPFSEADAAWFRGRREETEDLLVLVRREPLTVFYGTSGHGKTSLLHAGLFPLLREAGFLPISVRLDYGKEARALALQVRDAVD